MTDEDLEYVGNMFKMLSETFEREARISEQLVSISEEHRKGQAEAFRAASEACIKMGTRRLYVWPETWIGFTPVVEARP